jgi:hypothetical protein
MDDKTKPMSDWADEIALQTVRHEIGENTYSVELDDLKKQEKTNG